MKKVKIIHAVLLCWSVFMTAAVMAKESKAKTDVPAKNMATEKPMHFESQGRVNINEKNIEYTATAGTLVMKNEKDEAIAQFGYTAYVKKTRLVHH